MQHRRAADDIRLVDLTEMGDCMELRINAGRPA
jgi:hypothetical protein